MKTTDRTIWNKLSSGILAGLLVFISACTYGDTFQYTEQAGKVHVELDWGELPLPEGTLFFFYPEGQNAPVLRTGTAKGFEGTLPGGTYQMVVVNTGFRNLTIRTDDGYSGVYARIQTVTRADEVLSFPENLYGTGLQRVVVDGKKDAVFTAAPQNLVHTMQMDIVLEGVNQVKSIRGTLSGVSVSVYVPTGEAVRTETASVPIPLVKQPDGRFHSSVTTFGVNPTLPSDPVPVIPNRLVLEVELEDGTTFTNELDITKVIDDAVSEGTNLGQVNATIEVEMVFDPTAVGGFRLQLIGWHSGTGSAGNNE